MSPHAFAPTTSVIETHISRLLLTPDRVYKLLKPVTTDFLDFSDSRRRCDAAAKEFALNAAMAPDVYLGLVDIVERGELVDRMIVMRRLPAERQLDRLISSPQFHDCIEDVARHIATLHAAAEPIRDGRSAGASVAALRRNWHDNGSVIRHAVGPIISPGDFREVEALFTEYIDGRDELFQQRIDDGWVREGHGDLRAEHVFCLDDGPEFIDCLAFRDEYRIGDVLADVSFLAMDLHRLAGVEPAVQLLASYRRLTNEVHPMTLAHHYVAYRAHVRAKVECVRFGQGDGSAADRIRKYHQLALQHLRQARVRMVLVGGGAGTGKSTVAQGIAEQTGSVWIRSDEIRNDIVGVGHDEHLFAAPGEGAYRPEVTERVYDEMLRQAAAILRRGVSVVLDATWSSNEERAVARRLGAETSAAITELRCELPLAIARERIARRMSSIHNPSDASPEVADAIAASFDPWPEAEPVDTQQSRDRCVADGCLIVLRRISETWDSDADQHQPINLSDLAGCIAKTDSTIDPFHPPYPFGAQV